MTKVSLCKTQMALKVLLSLKVISERSVNLDAFFACPMCSSTQIYHPHNHKMSSFEMPVLI